MLESDYRNGHSPTRPHYMHRQQPSASEIERIQMQVAAMAIEPPSSRPGHPQRGYSPQMPRARPHTSPQLWNSSTNRQSMPFPDRCDDIAAYALKVVRDIEIPEDERDEKLEFCRELEEIVRRLRPSIPRFEWTNRSCHT